MEGLKCDCGGTYFLTDGVYKIIVDGEEYRFHGCKILECTDCQNTFVFESTVKSICEAAIEHLSEGKIDFKDLDFSKIKNAFIKQDYISTDIEFIFDRDDYYFIPGLIRPWNTGFLTPVFFNIKVLLKYAYHPDYYLEMGANTLGSIYKDKEHLIDFGINPNGKVIMWLGDIGKMEEKEQHYLRSENVESDHSISSEFYEAQIESVWVEPSNERKLLQNRLNLHEMSLRKLGTSISQLEPETVRVAPKIKRPLISSEEAFTEVIIPMNMIFVESINNKDLKKSLVPFEDVDVKDKKGLKLLELWIKHAVKLDKASDLISPLFVLYDLRVAMAHLQSNETKEKGISFACQRLGLDVNERNFLKIYDTLINALNNMYEQLQQGLEELSVPTLI